MSEVIDGDLKGDDERGGMVGKKHKKNDVTNSDEAKLKLVSDLSEKKLRKKNKTETNSDASEKKWKKKKKNETKGDGSEKKLKKRKRRAKTDDSDNRTFHTNSTVLACDSIITEVEPILIPEDDSDVDSTREVEPKSTSEEIDSFDDWFSPLHRDNLTLKKLENLAARGITPNKGRWTMVEVHRLHKNMMAFLGANKVSNFPRLIIPATNEEQLFRRETQFVLKMCKGIRRTYKNVYIRIIYQYSNFLNKGRYSKEERALLSELRNSGKSWKEIGLQMNRCHIGMSYCLELQSDGWTRGPWTREEDDLLRKALTKCNVSEERRNTGGTWKRVSALVGGTRPPILCWNRWKLLSRRGELELKEEVVFTESDEERLVKGICESGVDDEHLIDWIQLSGLFSDDRVTPQWLRCRWGALIKQVPRLNFIEFPEVVEKLYEIYQQKRRVREVNTGNSLYQY